MVKKTFLSIVVPCYNEEKNIRLGALNKISDYLAAVDFSWQVLIVDDGSQDNTVTLIKKFIEKNPRFRLIRKLHQGKARTVTAGILKAQGKYILFMDLDQAAPLSEVEKFLPYFKKDTMLLLALETKKEKARLF